MVMSSLFGASASRRRSGSSDTSYGDIQPLLPPSIIDAERGDGCSMPSPRGSREFHEVHMVTPRVREPTYPVQHLVILAALCVCLVGLCYLRISANHSTAAATALRAAAADANATAAR